MQKIIKLTTNMSLKIADEIICKICIKKVSRLFYSLYLRYKGSGAVADSKWPRIRTPAVDAVTRRACD